MAKPRSCTMADVAKAAGVSPATVSLALRSDRSIPPATREKVTRAAEALGYRPNPMVSALMANLRATGRKARKRVCSIAFLNTNTDDAPWQRRILHEKYFTGAKKRGEHLGFQVEPVSVREPGMTMGRLSKILQTRGVEGILIAPLPKGFGPIELDWSPFAVAALGYSVADYLSMAAHHNFGNMLTALAQLKRQGYRRIGFCISDELNTRVGRIWAAAFLQSHLGRPARENVPVCLFATPTFEKTFFAWMKRYRPDAVISSYGPPILESFTELELKVPDDIGFATMGQHPEHDTFSGVDEGAEVLGGLGIELVVEQLHRNERGIPKQRKIVLQDGTWRQGWTTRGER